MEPTVGVLSRLCLWGKIQAGDADWTKKTSVKAFAYSRPRWP